MLGLSLLALLALTVTSSFQSCRLVYRAHASRPIISFINHGVIYCAIISGRTRTTSWSIWLYAPLYLVWQSRVQKTLVAW